MSVKNTSRYALMRRQLRVWSAELRKSVPAPERCKKMAHEMDVAVDILRKKQGRRSARGVKTRLTDDQFDGICHMLDQTIGVMQDHGTERIPMYSYAQIALHFGIPEGVVRRVQTGEEISIITDERGVAVDLRPEPL